MVVPAWQNARWAPLLRNFRLVKSFPKGSQLFTRPAAKPGQRVEMAPTPWPVNVYRDKADRVEFLPGTKKKRRDQEPVTVELIIAQKGRILCRRTKDGYVYLPAKSGLVGGPHTARKLVSEVMQQHKVKENLGQLYLTADYWQGHRAVKTYHFAAPPVSVKKGRLRWLKIEVLA